MRTTKSLALMATLALALPLAGTAQDTPGVFKIPGTDSTIKFNGFAEMTLAYDVSGASPGDVYLNSPNIALSGTTTNTPLWQGTVAYSRFGVQTTTPSQYGTVGARFEGDFANGYTGLTGGTFTHSSRFRVRHAYATLGDWLLMGQTWSTYADLNAFPDQQDENPVYNLAPLRAPMVRVTFPAGPAKISLAAEDPYAQSTSTYHSLPDFIARLDVASAMGSFSLRAATKQFVNSAHSKQGFVAAAGGALKLGGDTLVVDVSAGTGAGPYIAATIAGAVPEDAIDTGTEIKLFNSLGASVGFTHVWTPQVRSNIMGSAVFVQTPDSTMAAAMEAQTAGSSLAANKKVLAGGLNTYFNVSKNFWIGLEYWLSYRQVFASGPNTDGTNHRVELNSHVDFF